MSPIMSLISHLLHHRVVHVYITQFDNSPQKMRELRDKALFNELNAAPSIDVIDRFFCPEGLLTDVFMQARWDFLYGAAEGG